MNRHERTAFLRSDEDDPDYLRDKPMGRCPWCGSHLISMGVMDKYPVCPTGDDCGYDNMDSELDNRARYQEERMAAAKIEERVNRELSRRGE